MYHYSISYKRNAIWPNNSRRQQMKIIGRISNNYCVASIVSALTPCHDVSMFSQKINQFSFSFISPLSSQNNFDFVWAFHINFDKKIEFSNVKNWIFQVTKYTDV